MVVDYRLELQEVTERFPGRADNVNAAIPPEKRDRSRLERESAPAAAVIDRTRGTDQCDPRNRRFAR
jgi:hypothetical protein